MKDKKESCKARWASHKNSRMADLHKLWRAYQEGEDSAYYKRVNDDIGSFHEYGLSFDYVAPNTFNHQPRGYWRYQISWGGPSEEFRFYHGENDLYQYIERVTFTFLDWYDGYERKLTGKDLKLMHEIFEFFVEIGSAQSEYDKAMEE